MKTLNNKYTKWYWALIETRRHQEESALTEAHHIIPRSLGGGDDSNNIIHLLRREHFVAHLLLSKMFTGKDKSKMRFAARQMLRSHTPNSRIYNIVKRDANLAMRALWADPLWRDRIVAERKIRMSDPVTKKKQQDASKKKWENPEYVEKHKAAMAVVHADPRWIEDNSEHMKSAWADPVKRDGFLKNRPAHTEERREKQSAMTTEQNKKSWADPLVRERRIQGIKDAAAKRKAAKIAALLSQEQSGN